MGKNIMLSNFAIFIAIIGLFLLPFILSGCADDDHVCRELRSEEIEPFLIQLTGHELPDKVEDLRAILFGYNGYKDLYVAFKTDQKGCLYMLDLFGGQDVVRQEFPQDKNNPFQWDIDIFDIGYDLQKKLGIVLFDKNLYDRVQGDALVHAFTGRYPKDAITGYYIEFDARSKLAFYRILVFKDLGIVYVFAEKLPEGSQNWR